MIKKFSCGLCKEEDRVVTTRWHLRKHLREVHFIVKEIANTPKVKKGSTTQTKRSWWIIEDWK